jgi:hypothetical protein
MWYRPTTFRKGAVLLALLACWRSSPARAQACCAGASAVTPGRLELHEDALVGMQARGAAVIGSFDPGGRYLASPAADSEYDLEQDLFGAVRVLPRGQVALLVPMIETERATPIDGSHAGGGFGDVNFSARYDFLLAGQFRYIPGVALLAGITFPSGTPVESAHLPLSVDATGVGAFQGNVALAFEQSFGPWLVNATGIVAKRAPTSSGTFATQGTILLAGAYSFPNDAAAVLAASYAFEGNATDGRGKELPSTSKRLTTISLSVLWPLGDAWRLLGGLQLNPPIGSLGSNQPATGGLVLTAIRSWS